MEDIKIKLKDIVTSTMIPEVEAYLQDLHKLLENNTAKQDDMDAIKEMESFLVELENILLALKEDKIPQDQVKKIYENILDMIEESKKH